MDDKQEALPSVSDWRFRTNVLGKVILQRCIERDGPLEVWSDASVTDLQDYLRRHHG